MDADRRRTGQADPSPNKAPAPPSKRSKNTVGKGSSLQDLLARVPDVPLVPPALGGLGALVPSDVITLRKELDSKNEELRTATLAAERAQLKAEAAEERAMRECARADAAVKERDAVSETLRSERQTTALQGDVREASAEVRRLEQQVAFLQEQNRGLLLSLMSMSSGATGTSNTASAAAIAAIQGATLLR